ncbi:hypothetical protein EST38_g2325 [Candolleomyces aberdarensis]|uniref:Uncharacterized protein n=1 Tax=Candolleomyces aberdarensis TaxID=2316362 RepID=A0A4Q2DX02_9AGAR|nr:hypothetical protein EST38_g2325 [Candolleomyces aberdarensis]
MSALDSGGVLKPILLRSSTPAPNEKVLKYLESMSKEEDAPTNSPPASLYGPPSVNYQKSPALSRVELLSPNIRSKFPDDHFDEEHHEGDVDGEDADSNIQVGERSEPGDLPTREPGPNDPPGPKYESYDSGPSFGNFGPFPTDDRASMNPPFTNSWNPDWNQIQNKHPSEIPWNQGTENGTSATPQNPGLPTEEFGITRAASPRSPSKAGSRAQSRVSGNGQDRPFSPGVRSRAGNTEKGTAYPPLPESAYGDFDPPLSPRSRAYSKAPSISPSDSPSQMPKPRPANRAFSPYRHAPTTEDLLHAAVRGRALVIPEESERESSVAKTPSQAPVPIPQAPTLSSPSRTQSPSLAQSPPTPKMPSQLASPRSKLPSHLASQVNSGSGVKTPTQLSLTKQSSLAGSKNSQLSRGGPPPPMDDNRSSLRGAQSPDGLDPEQRRMVNSALLAQTQTPRTSYYAQSVDGELMGHFHDDELCQLLRHESDATQPDVIRKALRKAIRQRVKKLGIKYDTEAIKQYKRSYRDHDHEIGTLGEQEDDEPPRWASDIKRELVLMQQRIESLGPKIENLRIDQSYDQHQDRSRLHYDPQASDDFTRTPQTRTVNIDTHPTGTMADSMYHGQDDDFDDEDGGEREFDDMTERHNPHRMLPQTDDGETVPRSAFGPSEMGRDDSPGQQFLEEELYKLKQRRGAGSEAGVSHRTWEIARDQGTEYEDDEEGRGAPSGLPTIPDTNGDGYTRDGSPPLPALPDHDEEEEEEEHGKQLDVHGQGPWNTTDYSMDATAAQQAGLQPWQRIHARLLNWAIIWPVSEFEHALNSTTRGHQVDEVALSIWSTQTYKRYVRARLTEKSGSVDRLFVPPNMADAISNAVFNGRHGEACGMLKDLWTPFGFDEMPRLIVVLAKHRSDSSHWVVHKFSLPDGGLTTYDSYPERTLPDGRPLGWWFAIRIAWPTAPYPKPDNLVQKMVRLHRPLQLPIDNSVAAAGIWRNVLMGSRAERSLDLES